MSIFLLIIAAFLAAAGQLFLKKAAISSVTENQQIIIYLFFLIKNLFAWLGAFSYAFSFLIYMIALKNVELSVARSFSTLSYIIIIILSVIIFKDNLNLITIIGSILISAGILLIGIGYH